MQGLSIQIPGVRFPRTSVIDSTIPQIASLTALNFFTAGQAAALVNASLYGSSVATILGAPAFSSKGVTANSGSSAVGVDLGAAITGDFTFAAIYAQSAQQFFILDTYNYAQDPGEGMFLNNGVVTYQTTHNGGGAGTVFTLAPASSAEDGSYNFVALTSKTTNGTATAVGSLGVNGTLQQASGTDSAPYRTNRTARVLAPSAGAYPLQGTGTVLAAAVWSTALTQAEVATFYAYWKAYFGGAYVIH